MSGPLGRRSPDNDWEHVEKYPLTAAHLAEISAPRPLAIGVNWYAEFDEPEKDSAGHYWIARSRRPTRVRGGHCVALKPRGVADNTAWWDFYDQGAEGACFTTGTLIEMADGSHKPIETVRTLDRVMTAEGHEGYVLQTHARFHADGLIRIRLRGHHHLRCTAEHPILTSRGYVAAGELRIGDKVRLPARDPAGVETVTTTSWLTEHEQRVTSTGTRWIGVEGRAGATATITAIPDQLHLTPELGRIIGLWLAEGSTTANKVLWTFGGHERDTLVEDLMGLLRSELGCEPRLQVRGSGALNVIIYGKHWRLLFERMLSHGPYEKALPGVLASGSREFLAAVLQGWLDGDGYRRRDRWSGVTVSHSLAMAMYRIGQILGLAPTIRWTPGKANRSAVTRRGRWDIDFNDSKHLVRAKVDEGGSWRKVVSLEHEEFAGHVFNLHVEGDNSYVAEGVGVHNCVGFGVSRMMTLLNRKRYEARWLWDRAKERDEYSDTNPGDDNGTSVNAGCRALRDLGHVAWSAKYANDDGSVEARAGRRPVVAEGISAYRWIRSIDDALTVLGYQDVGYVDIINSWGRSYPHLTRLPVPVLERLWREDGEIAVPTDR